MGIKFRAWDKHDEHYRSWENILSFRYNERWFLDNEDKEYINCIFTDTDLILEQYTGLNDKNGVEIYLNDIVKTRSDFEGDYFIESGNFVVEFGDGEFYIDCDLINWLWKCEVIGNIHENPELLEGK